MVAVGEEVEHFRDILGPLKHLIDLDARTPTEMVLFETRIRSIDQNVCAGCKMCSKCGCCNLKWCSLACCSCCDCSFCLSCCSTANADAVWLLQVVRIVLRPLQGGVRDGVPSLLSCIWETASSEPTYTVEGQPIFRAGKASTRPLSGTSRASGWKTAPFSR